MIHHLSRLTIFEYAEDAEDVDRAAVEAHLAVCNECRDVLEEAREFIRVLSDGSVFRHLADEGHDADLGTTLQNLIRHGNRIEEDARAADAFFLNLALQPVETWEALVAKNLEVCTAALVRRLVDAAGPELDRNSERALQILSVAELVAFALYDVESRRSLGHVWKQRSNALRMLGQYEKAIDAAIMAESFYGSLPDPDASFEVGQARYTIAIVLFKMTRYPAALEALASARAVLEEYGMTAPLAKILMLDALIRIEQGDVANARETLRELLPIEERLGQHLEAARVRANLAECNLGLGDLDAAMDDASAAIAAFQALGNIAEETRSEWTIGMIQLARGEADALHRLSEVSAGFRQLGMPGEAGFVQMDITEELLRRGEWAEAEVIARELVALFTAAGVTLASVSALDYLRQAVEKGEATTEIVRYVRQYVAVDDPIRAFIPPGETVN